MKKFISALFAVLMAITPLPVSVTMADDINENNEYITYTIYDEYGEEIAQKQTVYVGDSFLTTDFKKYEITSLNPATKEGFAKFIEHVTPPEIDISYNPSPISQDSPTICLYMSHNDESYITGDGYDSVYGKGGIHDVAKSLRYNFEQLGINAYIDETLHIPHDAYAYSRSSKTAQKLINAYTPDAIFDIHRDGASRSTYVKKINGKERCKVRIVVGKASKNFAIAEQFALYLLSVANKTCDWLFLDIYYASGHYNQGLYNKALLFEMGSHMVEKSLVLETVPELAKVVNKALFNTTVNKSDGSLTINGAVTNETPTISDALEDPEVLNEIKGVKTLPSIVYIVFVVGGGVIIAIFLFKFFKMPKNKTKSKKKK